MRPLAGASLAARVVDSWAVLEILVPRSDVYPLHPWMSGRLGLNDFRALSVQDPAGGARDGHGHCTIDDDMTVFHQQEE